MTWITLGLHMASLFLAPVLGWQGRQVRERARRIPEAEGPREGVMGTGKVCLRILIVGEASAAGVGARTQAQALAGRLSEALSQRLGGAVVWQLVAHRGDTTRDALQAIRTQPLHPADVMVTSLGLNDVLARVSPRRWLGLLDQLDQLAATRAGVHHVVHSGMPPVHSFLLPNPLRWILSAQAKRYNKALAAWVKGWPERWWLPLPFENEPLSDSVLMAEDGFHPGPAVYALWAEQLANMISSDIVPLLPQTTPTRRMAPRALQKLLDVRR